MQAMRVGDAAAGGTPRGELDLRTLREAQRGEPGACRALIARYRRPVGSLLRRMLLPAGLDALTEDLAQESFLRAFRALPRFEPDGAAKLSTWLLRIAARLAINELQRVRPPTRPLADVAVVATNAADDEHRRKAIGRAIREAVSQLQPEYRAAFLLREYHGLEYSEIAESLELDIGTVKSRLHRARTALRTRLAEVRHV
ncbi:MAG: sigma-70 family RNA polymerase sigma factor [Myxococcota bacterium]